MNFVDLEGFEFEESNMNFVGQLEVRGLKILYCCNLKNLLHTKELKWLPPWKIQPYVQGSI